MKDTLVSQTVFFSNSQQLELCFHTLIYHKLLFAKQIIYALDQLKLQRRAKKLQSFDRLTVNNFKSRALFKMFIFYSKRSPIF